MKIRSIAKLTIMLSEREIPFDFEEVPFLGGHHLYYPNAKDTVCSVIQFRGSYGYENNKLEIMGLLTDEESKEDSVVGNLSAEEVFKRIEKHYRGRKKNE